MPETAQRKWRRIAGIGLAITAAVGIAILVPALGRSGRDAAPPSAGLQTSASTGPTAPTRPPVLSSLADLPTGDPPGLAYVIAGSSVVLGNVSVDLEWEVSAIGLGSTEALVYDNTSGAIHRVSRSHIELLTGDATSAPVFGGNTAWIENDSEIVQQQYRGRARQPLPDGCCDRARVVGYDHDMDLDLFVTADESSWMWDTYEGGEGQQDPPPDSEDYFWPVGGLGQGTVADTGSGSEVLVKYPDREWGWGYVSGPRDPATDGPVAYEEQERVTATRVWLTSNAIVALESRGRLVVLGAEWRDDQRGHYWRELTRQRTALGLPDDLRVNGVVAEDRRSVLIDVTDGSGQRAWVRCDARTFQCQIATELGPADITPE